MADFSISVGRHGHVALVEFERGEANYFSVELIDAIADELDQLATGDTRAVVLAGKGRHFCAGADFTDGPPSTAIGATPTRHLYDAALRLFRQPLPLIAVVQGAAIGGGLGLAMACDFRVAADDARFAAPFARLGLHHGFGLTVTLPLVVGHQHALDMLYTARRIKADEALQLGLCDRVAPHGQARDVGVDLASTIAANAPIALQSIRQTMRGHLVDLVAAATDHEKAEQERHRTTLDFGEGIRADLARRGPVFEGR